MRVAFLLREIGGEKRLKLFGIKTKDIRADTTYSLNDADFLRVLGIDVDSAGNKLGEITYFTCLKLLSEIMGKLDIRMYQYSEKKGKERALNPRLEYLLNVEPNEYYTASTLKQAIELNRNHYGNAFVHVETDRKTGMIKALWILPTTEVAVWIDDRGVFGNANGVWYEWNDSRTGKKRVFNSNEILHFKSSITFDGINGMAIKDIISMQIDSAYYGERYIHKLYKGNMAANKVILHYTGDLNSAAKKALVRGTEEFSSQVGTGAFIPLPLGVNAEVLDSKLVDSEFSVLNKAKALSIAAAFGISPNGINDYSKSSYANSVTQQTNLYVNTMQPIFKAYNEEYTRRLIPGKEKGLKTLEIETKSLFKMNPIEQMDVLQKGVNSLLYTPNEGREELGLPYKDHPMANELVGNGNMINLENIGSQWKKGGEN